MTFVYELSNGLGEILYVGVADDLQRRMKQHSSDKPWFALVETVKWTTWDTRDDALQFERYLINTLDPPYNSNDRSWVNDPEFCTTEELARAAGRSRSAMSARLARAAVQPAKVGGRNKRLWDRDILPKAQFIWRPAQLGEGE